MSSEKEKVSQDLLSALDELDDCDIEKEKCTQLCQNVLEKFYSACETKINFTKEEKERIGSTLVKNIDKIQSMLVHFGFLFEPREGPKALKYRSALQFILDKFKDIELIDSSNTLGKEIEESDAFQVLEKAIHRWKKNITIGTDLGYTIENLYKPDDIPKHHNWWITKKQQKQFC